MIPRVTSFRLVYLTEITHTGAVSHALMDGSEGFKLHVHLSDKRRNLYVYLFNYLTNTHSESFEVSAEVYPEDSVLLRHDAASVGSLMHTFRQWICLRTYSVTSGQSACKETELSADPCLIYVRPTDRVTGITRTDAVRIGSARTRFGEKWKRAVTIQWNALPTMNTSSFRRRLSLVQNMSSSLQCQEVFLLRDTFSWSTLKIGVAVFSETVVTIFESTRLHTLGDQRFL
jgi:hypothetical protein